MTKNLFFKVSVIALAIILLSLANGICAEESDPANVPSFLKTVSGEGLTWKGNQIVLQTLDSGYYEGGYVIGSGSFTGIYGPFVLAKFNYEGKLQWGRTIQVSYGNLTCLKETIDIPGFIMAGSVWDHQTSDDVVVVKLDDDGTHRWSRNIGTSENFEYPRDIQETSDGGYVVTGYSYPLGGESQPDILVFKLDKTGKLLWSRVLRDSNASYTVGDSVQEINDGYIVLGRAQGDVLLIKLDVNGDFQWTKTVGTPDEDYGISIEPTSYGYVIAGGTSPDSYDTDIFLARFDSDLNFLSAQAIGGLEHDIFKSLCQTSEGNYAIAGWTQSFAVDGTNSFLANFDATGQFIDASIITDGSYSTLGAVQGTFDGGLITAGKTGSGSEFLLAKINSEGEIKKDCPHLLPVNSSDIQVVPLTFTTNPVSLDVQNDILQLGWSDSRDMFIDLEVTTHCLEYPSVNRPPVLNLIGDKSVNEGELLMFTVEASDPDGDKLNYLTDCIFDGASFDPEIQTFGWIPDYKQAGSYPITFKVTDGELDDSEAITITVKDVNRMPQIDDALVLSHTTSRRKPLSFTVTGLDEDGDYLQLLMLFSSDSSPQGATFTSGATEILTDGTSKIEGTFDWTPDKKQEGTYSILFQAMDLKGGITTSEPVVIEVVKGRGKGGGRGRK